jgi:hypothetical protein
VVFLAESAIWTTSRTGCTNPLQIEPNSAEMAFSGSKNLETSTKYSFSGNALTEVRGGRPGAFQTADFARFLKLECIRARASWNSQFSTPPPAPSSTALWFGRDCGLTQQMFGAEQQVPGRGTATKKWNRQ